MVGQVEVDFIDGERWLCANSIAPHVKITRDVADMAMGPIKRLLHNGVRVLLEGIYEPFLSARCRGSNDVDPKPKEGLAYKVNIMR
jgi:hypothetical protein